MRFLLIAMRPYQWLKNFFIFLPLVFGQRLLDLPLFLKTLYVFFAFSLVASSMYLINDILDIKQDRLHPEKRNRPIASGKIGILSSIILALILIIIGLTWSFILNKNCGFIFIVYIALNYLYMKLLKNAVIIDVFCIGAFFYLRILIGGTISGVELSNWIIMCTVLLALFLAFNKRRYDLEVSSKHRPVFSKYNQYFIDRMISVISSCVVMVYALYVMDPKTVERFKTNHLIYTIPFVLYGLLRYLYLIDTKWWGGDPAKILIGDYKMQLNLALWLTVCVGVIYFRL